MRAVTAARRTRLLSAASRRHSIDRWAGAGAGRAAALHTWLVQVVPSMMSDLEDVYLSVVAAVRDMVRVATGDIAHKVGGGSCYIGFKMTACRPQTSAPSVQFAEFNPVLILQYYEVSSSWEAAGDTLLREDFESLPLILKRELKSRSYI